MRLIVWDPELFIAVITKVWFDSRLVGVPEIRPVVVSKLRPAEVRDVSAARGVNVKLVGADPVVPRLVMAKLAAAALVAVSVLPLG